MTPHSHYITDPRASCRRATGGIGARVRQRRESALYTTRSIRWTTPRTTQSTHCSDIQAQNVAPGARCATPSRHSNPHSASARHSAAPFFRGFLP